MNFLKLGNPLSVPSIPFQYLAVLLLVIVLDYLNLCLEFKTSPLQLTRKIPLLNTSRRCFCKILQSLCPHLPDFAFFEPFMSITQCVIYFTKQTFSIFFGYLSYIRTNCLLFLWPWYPLFCSWQIISVLKRNLSPSIIFLWTTNPFSHLIKKKKNFLDTTKVFNSNCF